MDHLLKKLIESHYDKSTQDFNFKYEQWCGEFLKRSLEPYDNDKYLKVSNLHVAKNWLKVGLKVVAPKFGDIVVLNRQSPASWKGHVGLFVRKSSTGHILVFGGNQSGRVCISRFPVKKIAGFRRIMC